MKTSLKNKILKLTWCLLIVSPYLQAQSGFKYKASLPVIDSSGFYLINLKPELVAKTKPGFADLRIRQGDGQFAPYIRSDNLVSKDKQRFQVFPQVNFTSKTDTGTVYVISNLDRLTINELWLRLRNTAVSRTVSLTGSDDLKDWYAIKENVILEEAGTNDRGNYEQLLQFPSSTYHYLKILVNDKNKVPVKILQAGIYYKPFEQQSYVELPQPNFVQKDSGNVSRITLKFKDSYQLNRLHLNLSGTKFFMRRVHLYQVEGNNRYEIADTQILSAKPVQELFIHARGPQIELEIFNGDNPVLKLEEVHAFQIRQSIISYLEKGQPYTLLLGNPKASEPNYDIKFFTDSIKTQLPEINTGTLMKNAESQAKLKKEKADLTWLIWIAAIAALGLLTFVTFKMVKEVGKI